MSVCLNLREALASERQMVGAIDGLQETLLGESAAHMVCGFESQLMEGVPIMMQID